ncbi:hypothetical protein FA09DRAFT_113997 [Tilletiopsis washingtonensis]|jgi:hypothetical protein|uniref:Uncharacterized protein n=1 Tax=Tilletiopsis washingtonensis TaxID=58919 RepID=A0A316ZKF2_9BASI|nr:hypothetical protein FA09DRAFT_113997 [Tilletiopsis washingtonensis]PWO00784.1 hypothetical protein FA09DRAFT_113997 [Tilletiopsis washingtonensis]
MPSLPRAAIIGRASEDMLRPSRTAMSRTPTGDGSGRPGAGGVHGQTDASGMPLQYSHPPHRHSPSLPTELSGMYGRAGSIGGLMSSGAVSSDARLMPQHHQSTAATRDAELVGLGMQRRQRSPSPAPPSASASPQLGSAHISPSTSSQGWAAGGSVGRAGARGLPQNASQSSLASASAAPSNLSSTDLNTFFARPPDFDPYASNQSLSPSGGSSGGRDYAESVSSTKSRTRRIKTFLTSMKR